MIGTMLAAGALAAAPASVDARQAYAQRIFLLEADAACQLLTPRERAALEGSALQARGALLRAGVEPSEISRAARDHAHATDCDDETLAAETARAGDAFARWAATIRQDFPGDVRSWRASRVSALDSMAWTLWQDLAHGYRLGRTEDAETSALVLAIPTRRGAAAPRMAALEFRDAQKWREFIDPTLGGLFAASSNDALARRAAPSSLSRRVWAGGDVEKSVQPPDPAGSWIFWSLPETALDDLASLDPREAARLLIEYQDGRVQELYLEIGDLAGALGFLAAGDTPSTRLTVTN